MLAATAHASGEDWEDSTVKPPPAFDEGHQGKPPNDPEFDPAPNSENHAALEGEDIVDRGRHTGPDTRDPTWGVEIRLTPFKPVLSSNPKVRALYNLVYENGQSAIIKAHPMMFGVDFDWYPVQTFGLRSPLPGFLGVFARLAYWTVSGPTRLCYQAGNPSQFEHCTAAIVFNQSTTGNDTGSINVIPLSLGVVYRLDSIRKNTGFPLVFNFKGSFDYYIWWASSGAGAAHFVDPNTGAQSLARGGTLGFSASAGASLGLDAFGGKVTSGGRSNTRSALFAEFMLQDGHAIAGANPANRLDFTSDEHALLTIGLELEFL